MRQPPRLRSPCKGPGHLRVRAATASRAAARFLGRAVGASSDVSVDDPSDISSVLPSPAVMTCWIVT
jgi:hypothetical protein